MLKVKDSDGQIIEFKNWCDAHEDVKTSMVCEGVHHCGESCGANRDFCECIKKCVLDDFAKNGIEVLPDCEACNDTSQINGESCEECCEHSDTDDRTCLDCGADLTESRVAMAEYASDTRNDR